MIKLEFPKFITHVNQSKKKKIKIGFNQIYASSHYSVRNKIVDGIHQYLLANIPDGLQIATPVVTELQIHVPKNYSNVRNLKGKLSWKYPDKDYSPNWDIDNLAFLWIKCLNDCLQKKGVFPDDTVEFIVKTSYAYVECVELDDRKLVYILKTK